MSSFGYNYKRTAMKLLKTLFVKNNLEQFKRRMAKELRETPLTFNTSSLLNLTSKLIFCSSPPLTGFIIYRKLILRNFNKTHLIECQHRK